MKGSIIAVALALACLAGCADGNVGIYALPVRLPVLQAVIVPGGTLTAGDSVQFTANWTNGRVPFTVSWDFDDGAEPLTVLAQTPDQTHTATVTLVNEGAAAATYTGQVTVTDAGDNQVASAFSYTVEPAV